jgi:Plasmid pRiA4b ORF-3-like protein
MAATPFKRLILRAVLRDVNPMVIRLTAVPDFLDLADFDDIFHTVLGWDSGIGYAFQVQGQEFNSFRRQTKTKKLRDFRLHRQEKFLYTLGAMDQWEWELRVVDLQDGVAGGSDRRSQCGGVSPGGRRWSAGGEVFRLRADL